MKKNNLTRTFIKTAKKITCNNDDDDDDNEQLTMIKTYFKAGSCVYELAVAVKE